MNLNFLDAKTQMIYANALSQTGVGRNLIIESAARRKAIEAQKITEEEMIEYDLEQPSEPIGLTFTEFAKNRIPWKEMSREEKRKQRTKKTKSKACGCGSGKKFFKCCKKNYGRK